MEEYSPTQLWEIKNRKNTFLESKAIPGLIDKLWYINILVNSAKNVIFADAYLIGKKLTLSSKLWEQILHLERFTKTNLDIIPVFFQHKKFYNIFGHISLCKCKKMVFQYWSRSFNLRKENLLGWTYRWYKKIGSWSNNLDLEFFLH